jgi:hypothetical protein
MRPPIGTRELLDAWERGRPLPHRRRAAALLAAADPGATAGELEGLSVGRTDARLLALREAVFGRVMPCLVACPSCGESLELALDTAGLTVPDPEPPGQGPLRLEREGYELEVRPPANRDLAEVEGSADADEARRRLLERCIVSARYDGREVPAADLPATVTEAAAARIARADPQADCRLDLTCPACGHHWQAPFDVLSYLWAEVHAWAQRVFREVHRLAFAYGWSESEVLALSPTRRQIYLEMLGE